VTRAEYDALKALNYSRLKLLARSPAHLRHADTGGEREDSDAMLRGRLVHLSALEPQLFESSVAVFTGARRAGKEWEAFLAANAGREIAPQSMVEDALRMALAVRQSAQAAPLLREGKAEHTVQFNVESQPCKARLDWVATFDGRPVAIVDLKTAKDASPRGFGRAAWDAGYHTQGAWYVDALLASGETERELPYYLLAVESEPPHVVQLYEVPPEVLDVGRAEYARLFRRYVECCKSGVWPGYSEEGMLLQLPAWARAEVEAVQFQPSQEQTK
jgi:exodeoxyribonuclease VIII